MPFLLSDYKLLFLGLKVWDQLKYKLCLGLDYT
jgi:hypothetical protein